MERGFEEIGPWKKLRVLGSGAFGQVTLWYNSITGQKIAIKKLQEHLLKDVTTKSKQTERWCKEVEIMKKLNHINIVATLEIPSGLNITAPLPILAMEYCSRGDLRQVLNKPENCCGLREPEILDILRDVSNGLAYLHSCKIIHRDLKPDNIVLQEKDLRIVYKLIDLGYAKELDQSSLSKSFVGTIQYIAPELFLGKAYTSSVDYWSFGLLTHEIITGFRPFLPGFSPSDWMKQIQNKSRDIICVLENSKGDITFSSSISRTNHLSRCFLEDIEKWLRLALDWDGQTRGRDPEKNRPIIFEELGNILCKKVIKVFSVPTCQTLSFEINAEADISDLRRWLKENTDLEEDDQLLLLPSGRSLTAKGNLLYRLKNEKLDRHGITIFLYNCGTIKIRSSAMVKPKFVDELEISAKKLLKYRHLKRNCADSVYFIQSEALRYCNLMQGVKAKIDHTKQKTLAIETLYEEVGEEWNKVENYGQFMSLSHKIDIQNYIHYRKTGKLKSSLLVRKWIQHAIVVDKKITELKNSFNKGGQKQAVAAARQRCRNLETHSACDVALRVPLDDIVKEGQRLWDNVQKLSKDDRDTPKSNERAASLINRSLEESSKLLKSQTLRSLFSEISEADDNLAKFLSHLTALLKSIKILELVIENTQKERQKEVWGLIGNVKDTEKDNDKAEKAPEEEMSQDGEDIIKNGGFNSFSTKAGSEPRSETFQLKRSDNSESNLSSRPDFGSELSLQNSGFTSSIIDDNNHLRYRIQDVQQTCHQMVKEIRELKWDFINENQDQDDLTTT